MEQLMEYLKKAVQAEASDLFFGSRRAGEL